MSSFIDNLSVYAKGIAGLVAAIATSLLTIYGADTDTGKTLTVVVAIAGAVAVYALPNRIAAADEENEPGI